MLGIGSADFGFEFLGFRVLGLGLECMFIRAGKQLYLLRDGEYDSRSPQIKNNIGVGEIDSTIPL